MVATGWPTLLVIFEISALVAAIGHAPWFGTGYDTYPEVFRDTARPPISAAGSDVTMKRGPVSSDTITMLVLQLDQLCPHSGRWVHDLIQISSRAAI